MSLLAIAGTCSVTNGSANVTFSQAQTLPAGLSIVFAAQPAVVYQLNAAISAATAGVLTFAYSGTTNAATAVTVQRQIILLDGLVNPGPNIFANAIFWLVPNPNRIIPVPGFASQIPAVSSAPGWGVSAAESALLLSGNLVEQTFAAPPRQLIAGVEAELQASYLAKQAALSAAASGSKLVGLAFDGNSWTFPP